MPSLNPHQQHNAKIDAATLRTLKRIAAATGEKQYAVLARLVAAEWHRVQSTPPQTAERPNP
jgi:hypothetical protein